MFYLFPADTIFNLYVRISDKPALAFLVECFYYKQWTTYIIWLISTNPAHEIFATSSFEMQMCNLNKAGNYIWQQLPIEK